MANDKNDPGNDLQLEKEKEAEVEIIFRNKEVWAEVSRTIKTSESQYEFSKYALGFRASIDDNVQRAKASDKIFNELMTESILREAAIRAAAKDPTILDRIVILLRKMIGEKGESL
jgi:hypothetical protein